MKIYSNIRIPQGLGFVDENYEDIYQSGYTAGYESGYTDGQNDCPEPEPVYSAMPLTFRIISGGTISWTTEDNSLAKTIQYSLNDGEWTNITSTTGSGTEITVNTGDIVQFVGDNTSYGTSSVRNGFSSTAIFKVEGNIMSLIDSTGYQTATTLRSAHTFYGLFKYCSGLTSAANLKLPATTLSNYCYRDLFMSCTSLTAAPVLPATTLAKDCYTGMFASCTSLTTAPELPATTLQEYCYNYMFRDCTSLTTAPELPATTLVRCCYQRMFYRCESLSYVKCLATSISAFYALESWLGDVAATGTFVKNSNMTGWTTGIDGIPNNWTIEEV